MASIDTAIALNSSSLLSSRNNAQPQGIERTAPLKAKQSETNTASQAVILSLSPAARNRLGPVTPNATSYYQPFFPVREGFSSQALAEAVNDPGKETNSKGLTFSEVAADARKHVNNKYAELAAAGKPFDQNGFEFVDYYTAYGDLDRRSLFAIRRNEGDQFSNDEVAAADAILGQQQSLAAGLYSGPSRLNPGTRPVSETDLLESNRRSIRFLDRLSGEEKSTGTYLLQRAALQASYEALSASSDRNPENLDNGDPVIRKLANFFKLSGNTPPKNITNFDPAFRAYLSDILRSNPSLAKTPAGQIDVNA